MHTSRRLASLLTALIGATLIAAAPARAVEPGAPFPDSLWDEPLFAAPPAAEADTASEAEPQFLPPIVLDGAAGAAAVAPSAGGARRAGAPTQGGTVATPYVAAGRRGDVRAPSVSFPDGVLAGPQMTLNPDGTARVTVIPELGTVPNFGTTVRGAGVSVQGGSSRVGVGVGLSRDETGRTSGGLGVTLTLP
jgi:hypothetical protein